VHADSCAQIKLLQLLSWCVATELHGERRCTEVGRCTLSIIKPRRPSSLYN